MDAKDFNLTQQDLLELFEYKNGDLYNKKPRSKVKVGEIAGSILADGYRQVKIGNRSYKVHRVIFMMQYGYLSPQIDHINGNKSDNRIENLRPATNATNQYNRKSQRNNTTGHKNIHFCNRSKRYVVSFRINGKLSSYGYFADIGEAKNVAMQKRIELHKEYANHDF
jgi:type II secretory ATPase GspE/PulE/Tfp pilus assembly ATPase PilB-like protein